MADTIGVGTPRAQAAMERALKHFPSNDVSGHFHDTYGRALANIYACLEMGIHAFDASGVPGLGGCPRMRRRHRQRRHRDVVFMLSELGIASIDLDALVDAGAFISGGPRPPCRRAGKGAAI